MPVKLSCKIPITGLPTQNTKPIKRSVEARFHVTLRASHCQRHCFQKCCKQLGAVLFDPAASENKTILDLCSGVRSTLCFLCPLLCLGIIGTIRKSRLRVVCDRTNGSLRHKRRSGIKSGRDGHCFFAP